MSDGGMNIESFRALLLPLTVVSMALSAFAVTVERLPESEYADTEISTNIPFEVDFTAMSRMYFTISLDASPSNCVEVSIGSDANADSDLTLDETAYSFGYDCGRFFTRCAEDNSEISDTDRSGRTSFVTTGRVERVFLLKKRKLDESWNLVKVTRRGMAEIGDLTKVEGQKPGMALTFE